MPAKSPRAQAQCSHQFDRCNRSKRHSHLARMVFCFALRQVGAERDPKKEVFAHANPPVAPSHAYSAVRLMLTLIRARFYRRLMHREPIRAGPRT